MAIVIAHELAHQWFGNLVTPDWWSDLWLNEGFASYIEYVGVNHVSTVNGEYVLYVYEMIFHFHLQIEPKWNTEEQFVYNSVQNVFLMDSLKSTHSISAHVSNPEEINELFDSISYKKGDLTRFFFFFLFV